MNCREGGGPQGTAALYLQAFTSSCAGWCKPHLLEPPAQRAQHERDGDKAGPSLQSSSQGEVNNQDLCGRWPLLLVCPSSVLDNWMRELGMWGTFRAAKLHGSTKDSGQALAGAQDGSLEIVLTTYDTYRCAFSIAVSLLCSLAFATLVFEECIRADAGTPVIPQLVPARLPTRTEAYIMRSSEDLGKAMGCSTRLASLHAPCRMSWLGLTGSQPSSVRGTMLLYDATYVNMHAHASVQSCPVRALKCLLALSRSKVEELAGIHWHAAVFDEVGSHEHSSGNSHHLSRSY